MTNTRKKKWIFECLSCGAEFETEPKDEERVCPYCSCEYFKLK